jgi:hypothetical protein
MNRVFLVAASLLLSSLMSCNNKSEQVNDLDHLNKNIGEEQFQAADSVTQVDQEPGTKSEGPKTASIKTDWDKKIVRTATLNAEVKDYQQFSNQLSEKVRLYGGYISSEDQKQDKFQIENTAVIKVPVDQFDNLLADLSKTLTKIHVKQVSSEDVTTALMDGKSRLEAKKQVRLRYLDLLKGAKNMEEIFQVQKEINGIQEEIEMVNGRINLLSHSSALSTIHLNYFQVLDATARSVDSEEKSFSAKLRSAFSNGWYWIGELILTIASIWPMLLAIGIVYLLFKSNRNKITKSPNP